VQQVAHHVCDVVGQPGGEDLGLVGVGVEQRGVLEALWWWQFSYLSDWGERASSVLRTLQTMLAHLRLDVEDDVAAEAEYDALQP
jgi:hypothetical protein